VEVEACDAVSDLFLELLGLLDRARETVEEDALLAVSVVLFDG